MSFGTQDEIDDVMNEINMTPLVDVMLVLLIIFIITVPVMKHAVNIDLPRASNQREESRPETVRLSVDAKAPTGTSSVWTTRHFRTCCARRRPQTAAGPAHSAVTKQYATSASPKRWRCAAGQAQKLAFITEPETPDRSRRYGGRGRRIGWMLARITSSSRFGGDDFAGAVEHKDACRLPFQHFPLAIGDETNINVDPVGSDDRRYLRDGRGSDIGCRATADGEATAAAGAIGADQIGRHAERRRRQCKISCRCGTRGRARCIAVRGCRRCASRIRHGHDTAGRRASGAGSVADGETPARAGNCHPAPGDARVVPSPRINVLPEASDTAYGAVPPLTPYSRVTAGHSDA